MLGPDSAGDRKNYTLFLEAGRPVPFSLGEALERKLRENPHYGYCISLGQLTPVRVFQVERNAYAAYVDRERREGRRIGDIKPAVLSARDGWPQVFEGGYVQAPGEE